MHPWGLMPPYFYIENGNLGEILKYYIVILLLKEVKKMEKKVVERLVRKVSLEGSSLAVHLPKSWGAAQGIGKGSKVVLEFLSDGSILIRRADKNE